MKIIFFGTPSFAGEILEYLIDHKINIAAIVTQSEKIRGKESSVKSIAEKRLGNIRVFQPNKATDSEFIQEMKDYHPDLFVVIAYGKILRQALLDVPSRGAINVHASLLPKYRGAAPIQRALLNGEKETGVSIMLMTSGLDSGDVIALKKVPIDDKINCGELQNRLCHAAKPLLLDVLKMFEKGKLTRYPQDESLATYAPKITTEDLNIDFENDALFTYNQIRAFSPSPGAVCFMKINGQIKRVKIFESEIVILKSVAKKIVKFEKDEFIIACKENAILVNKLQLEGKKIVAAGEFIRGIKGNLEII